MLDSSSVQLMSTSFLADRGQRALCVATLHSFSGNGAPWSILHIDLRKWCLSTSGGFDGAINQRPAALVPHILPHSMMCMRATSRQSEIQRPYFGHPNQQSCTGGTHGPDPERVAGASGPTAATRTGVLWNVVWLGWGSTASLIPL